MKVFVADDHRLFRAGLVELLKDQADLSVVGEAAEPEEACRLIDELLPDLVLMDIDFGPGRETAGIEATERITARHGERVKVVMLTMHDEDERVLQALEAGAVGYVLKEATPKHLLQTLHEVHRGGVMLAPRHVASLVARLRRLRRGQVAEELDRLTPREREILALVARGASNAEIADRLGLSEKTVRNRLSLLFGKLRVSNRTQAARIAARLGLLED